MKVPYGALATALATLEVRCDRVNGGRRCGRLVAEVLLLGGRLVMLQAPHEVPTYRWGEGRDFDGVPYQRRDGWTLRSSIPLDMDRQSNMRRRSFISAPAGPFRYDQHSARHEQGFPSWRADAVESEPLLLAAICCSEVRVLSGEKLIFAFSRSASSVDCGTVLYSGDAKQFIADHL